MGFTRLIAAGLALVALCAPLRADDVPLPRPRPVIYPEPQSFAEANPGLFDTKELTAEISECRTRLNEIAAAEPLPRLVGPGECGGTDMVRLGAVLMPDRSRIALNPAPVLRCPMAESFASWVRDQLAPGIATSGTALRSIDTYDDFECRGRNRVFGAKLSEHGKGNAVDVRAFRLADGRVVMPTDLTIARELREEVRLGACRMFTTVLGPGSDGYHESHIHLDVAERTRGYRICQWDIREPQPDMANNVPLPIPRPASLQNPAANRL